MKIMKILEIILILKLSTFFLQNLISCSEIKNKSIECLIQSNAYKFEYLYPSFDLNKKYNPHKLGHIYTGSLSRINNFDTLRWKIIQINKVSFHLKSVEYKNEYLCATSSYSDLLRKKRKVQTKFVNSTKIIGKECEWIFKKVISKDGVYNIWNAFYGEPMYSVSYLFKYEPDKRNVYLWHREPVSNQFEWIIDCRTGNYFKNNKYFI
jgi:hypothetical protein